MRRDAEHRLARTSTKQHGAFTRAQALDAGYSEDEIDRLLASGRWLKQARAVYASADVVRTWDFRLHVALLAGGENAVAARATAAFVHGLREKRPPIIDVSIPRTMSSRRLPGAHFRRATRVDAVTRGGIRVTTVPQTIVDLSSTPELDGVLDNAIHKRRTTVAQMKSYVAKLRTNPGLRRLRKLLDDREKGRLTTELERRFDELLKRSPLPYPARQHPIGSRFADFAYVDERIVIELDGGDSHMRREVFEDDRARQNELVLRGWTILRFTWDDVTKRPERVVATIGQMLETSSRNLEGTRPPDAASP